jgi:hypothetical protein
VGGETDLDFIAAEARASRSVFATTRCTFASGNHESSLDGTSEQAGILDLSPWVDESPMTLSLSSAQEIVVQLFQRMVSEDLHTLCPQLTLRRRAYAT